MGVAGQAGICTSSGNGICECLATVTICCRQDAVLAEKVSSLEVSVKDIADTALNTGMSFTPSMVVVSV